MHLGQLLNAKNSRWQANSKYTPTYYFLATLGQFMRSPNLPYQKILASTLLSRMRQWLAHATTDCGPHKQRFGNIHITLVTSFQMPSHLGNPAYNRTT